ncbi:hypothetical protein RV12_GL002299 [Enterococcus quebecensis]|nr:hypothetical protein RV12_GL002299 [Enterococcus quebecensis]
MITLMIRKLKKFSSYKQKNTLVKLCDDEGVDFLKRFL